MAKYTYIAQHVVPEGEDILVPYSSMKAAWNDTKEDLCWGIDKLKRHDWSKPISSFDGKLIIHRTHAPLSTGDLVRIIQED